jgi:ATP-dependent DNA helicase RecG
MVEDSELMEGENVLDYSRKLAKELPSEITIGVLHGRMKPAEKNQVMEDFSAGKIQVLVSTTVVEVGVDVPNATVMMIENAERFGLAQLHQLRGRVGRGSDQSYCFLVSQSENEVSKERNAIMCRTNDGFEIAEADLKLRGPGEIFGTRQHGLPELHISDLVRHGDVLEKAKDAAKEILTADPNLNTQANVQLKMRIKKMFGDEIKLEL